LIHQQFKVWRSAAVATCLIGLGWTPLALADWTGKSEAGLLIATGNSASTSVNAKIDVAREDGPWKSTVHVAGQYGKNAVFTTGERLEGSYELDHKISDKLFGFVGVAAEHDLFDGFQYQATLSTGVGYTWYDSADTKLSTTVGVGYRRLRPEMLTKDASGQVTARTPLDQADRQARDPVRLQRHCRCERLRGSGRNVRPARTQCRLRRTLQQRPGAGHQEGRYADDRERRL